MPKWALDCSKHEVRRAARVTSDKTLENIAFVLPSKSGLFQPELYPPFPSNTPNSKIEEWKQGTNKPPITMELRPEKKQAGGKKGGLSALLKSSSAQSDSDE